jgi:glutamyl-tRNA reductase
MDRLVCVGLSHRTAPVELRMRVGALGAGAGRCPAVSEHAVLQTCYRVELYAQLAADVADARDELLDALSTEHGMDREVLLDHLYVHGAEDVARHLCRVSTGLDSLVLGEAEILGQVGTAFANGVAAGTVGPALSLLFRTAITAGRRARSETSIGANPATASSMALSLAESALGDLRDKNILVIGAGRIGVQTLQALSRRRLDRLSVANRTRSRASDLAAQFGASPHTLAELESCLAAADLAITATSSEQPVVSTEVVHRAMSRRPDRPLVVVDLAVPADVERDAGAVAAVQLFDVDDLRAGLDEAIASRLGEVPRVEAIVEDEVLEFGRRYRRLEVAPLLSALRKQAETMRRAELDRALGDLGDIDPRVAERIDYLTRTLVTRLLHDPTVRLRERAGAGGIEEVADTVRDVFGISAPPHR